MKLRVAGLLLLAASFAAGAATRDEQVFTALQDEMRRSMEGLRLEGQPAPYYIAYQLDEVDQRRQTSQGGELISETSARTRVLRVEVRVGDYGFDSSLFASTGRGVTGVVAGDSLAAPLDDNVEVMRRQVWLLTDAAYKRAVDVFARKKAVRQNRSDAERIADFTKMPPVQRPFAPPLPESSWSAWAARAHGLSALVAANPQLAESEVNLVEERGRRFFINSEGTRICIPIGVSGMRVTAVAQAADGATVRDGFELNGRGLDDLPSQDELEARVRAFAAGLDATRSAGPAEDYTGPVLFEAVASAELVGRVLVPALQAGRAPEADNPAMERITQARLSPFLTRIGSRVMAEELSVTDAPSTQRMGTRPVPGAYDIDDEGVPAQDVTLIDRGKLLTLLSNRTPTRAVSLSNGHGRGGDVQAGVIQLKSSAAVPARDLRANYLALLKSRGRQYGYIVRSMPTTGALVGISTDIADVVSLASQGSAGGGTGPLITQLVRVSVDGQEQVVRGMRFGTLAPNLFRDVLGASEELALHTLRSGPQLALGIQSIGARAVPVSVIAPQLIVDDLEIKPVRDSLPKPPLVPAPPPR
jgi:hypothetical protein